MKLPDLFVNAITTFDGKALAKGQKQISGFEKGVKSFAKAFGLAFSAQQIAQFGKASVKAFAEDEKAAVKLTQSVKNLGLGFEDARIKNFISDLEAAAGVSDDILRPAFQTLISTTGSVARSQELLTLALDISAGSGVDAAEVAKDLSLAYLGQTKGLAKYNTGLTKAELSVAGFAKLQEKLNTQYSGQNAQRLKTYAGQMEFLGVAAGNAQEVIGKGLVDALMILSGDTTVEDLAESMKNAADNTSTLITNVAKLIKTINTPLKTVAGGLTWFIEKTDKFVDLIVEGDPSGFLQGTTKTPGAGARSKSPAGTAAAAKARAKAEAEANKRAKELLASQKKQQIAEKNKLSLSKAAAVFDTQRISIAAALRATYDKETRLRLEALMAIEDENGDLALKKIGELAAFQKNADLAKLAGIKEIGEATLNELNTRLLTELKVINDSKMAEGDKELAREEAFKKYNAAIEAAGTLAAKEQYSERTQIQLTEIARLASQSNTTNALKTQVLLREQAELSMIDRVARAQKAADDARLSALQTYINLLNKANAIPANTTAIQKMTPAQAEAVLAKEPASVPTTLTPAQIRGLNYAAQGQAAYENSLSKISLTDQIAQASLAQGLESGLSLAAAASGARYAAQAAASYTLQFNTGVISQPDEFVVLIQDTIQKINRGGDPLTTAGTL
jgi:hypothetical protein